jgi:hypothetical protein
MNPEMQNRNYMKTNAFRVNWLIPLLGIALFGVGYPLSKSYLSYQEQIRSGEQMYATVGRLIEDCNLSQVLIQAQNGGCEMTARRLDELLAANIMTEGAQLASADAQTRALADFIFDRVARLSPLGSSMPSGMSQGRSDLQSAAPGLLAQALAGASADK